MQTGTWGQRLWLAGKWLLAAGILVAVGIAFARALARLDEHELHWEPGWLIVSGVSYVIATGFSALYWWWALRSLGQRPAFLPTIRAYSIGHLGKYVPGKALVIVLRTSLIRGPAVRASVAAMAVVYETLTCMAAGAMLAAALIAIHLHEQGARLWQVLLLLVIAGVPTLPWIFNPVARWLLRPFRQRSTEPLPAFRTTTLLGGLGMGAASWLVAGISLWAAVRAVQDYPLGVSEWLTCTAFLCVAAVGGFVTPVPGGLGVREGILLVLFAPALGEGPATVVALLLRLTWIITEVLVAAVLYPLGCDWSDSGGR